MNICYRILGLIILVSFLTPNEIQAQDTTKSDFEAFIESLAKENVPGYVQPFATALGTAINSGIYHTAKIHGLTGFDIGFRAMMISIPDDGLSYTAEVGGDPIENSPTVFGGASSNAFLPDGLGSENSQSRGIKVSEIQLGDESRGIYLDSPDIVEQNPLLAELTAFVNSIRNDEEPMVTGEDGLAALETASQIITSINNSAM